MNPPRKFSEKRNYLRISVNAEMTYSIPGENITYKGYCRNLSHSGIQFETEQSLHEGTMLEMNMDSKSKIFKPLKALVRIVRLEESDNNHYRAAGIIKEYR